MPVVRSPSEPPIPPPPDSGVHRTDLHTLRKLSPDGLAAVLHHARKVLIRERCSAPYLRPADLDEFVARAALCAREASEGIYLEDSIFIDSLFRVMRSRGEVDEGSSLEAFKSRLIDAFNRGRIMLTKCLMTDGVDPAVLRASKIRQGEHTFHLMRRGPSGSLHQAINEVSCALSRSAAAGVMVYAQRVLKDERLREGKPRLSTLSPEAFAVRVQEIVNRGPGEMLVAELYRRLSEGGETTGMGLAEFKAWLLAGHWAGRLMLCVGEQRMSAELIEASAISHEGATLTAVRRTGLAPIPWGPPPRVVGPRRVQGMAVSSR